MIRKPFVNYGGNKEAKSKVYTVRLNPDERATLADGMRLIRQPKHSTALKMFANIGMEAILHDAKTRAIFGVVSRNTALNTARGIPDSEIENKANVIQTMGKL
jgi:hypothetical protein